MEDNKEGQNDIFRKPNGPSPFQRTYLFTAIDPIFRNVRNNCIPITE
jgi:hypothetical protein